MPTSLKPKSESKADANMGKILKQARKQIDTGRRLNRARAVVQIETQSSSLTTKATAITVTDQPSLDHANTLLGTIKALRTQIAATFDPIISKAHEAHKEALAQKKKLDGPLTKAESTVKATMAAYLDDLETKRLEAERIAAEAKREAEAVVEAKLREQEDTAKAMLDAGLGELVFDEPVEEPEPVFREHIPVARMEASYSQTKWYAEVVDTDALIRGIIAGVTSTEAVTPNMAYLNGLARAKKQEGELVPGVKAVRERSISHKSGS